MEKQKVKSIMSMTSELYDGITDIYEDLMDENDIEALLTIEQMILRLKEFRSSLIIRED